VNKDDDIYYFVYTSVQSVNYCDGLGLCFPFVCIYACTSVFLCCYRFSVNKDLYSSLRGGCVQCRTPKSLIVDAIATDVIRDIVQGGAENCGTLYIG